MAAALAGAVPAVAGDLLSGRDRRRLAKLVDRAERVTGLQIAVYVGPTEEDPGAHAERILQESGGADVPAVLLLVAPESRRIEIRTAPEARLRVPDDAAQRAVAAMSPVLAEGKLVAGVAAGLEVVVAAAGPKPQGAAEGPELPDVITP